MRLILSYIALAVGIVVVLTNAGGFFQYRELAASGTHVFGQVVELHCQNHESFAYDFKVDGRLFQGSGQSDKPCTSLKVGEAVDVYFLPRAPSINTSRSPSDLLQNEEESIGLAALVAPALILWLARRWWRRRPLQ